MILVGKNCPGLVHQLVEQVESSVVTVWAEQSEASAAKHKTLSQDLICSGVGEKQPEIAIAITYGLKKIRPAKWHHLQP